MDKRDCNGIGISVIIPIYNVEQYLEDCLKSVLAQSFTAYEMICVNDASTDTSLEILERYANMYSNIRIVNHKKNKGLSAARNTGVDIALGKYIMFLDSDDMIIPETLEELYSCAESNNLDEIYFNMKYIYEIGSHVKVIEKQYVEYLDICNGQEMFCRFQKDNIYKIEACRQFYRKEFLITNNLKFYEGILHEDMLFSFLCAMNAERVMNINREYYIYRQRNGSIMSTMSKKRAESMYIVLMEVFKYWNSHVFSIEVEQAISSYLKRGYALFLQYKSYCSDFEISVGTTAERFLYELINEKKSAIVFSKEQMELLRNTDNVIVYGAGKIGIDVIHSLNNYGIDISAVAVSSKIGNADNACGIKIREITELLNYKENSIVIVAVSLKYQKDVIELLERLSFQNIMFIED